jgi:hypothetical protein
MLDVWKRDSKGRYSYRVTVGSPGTAQGQEVTIKLPITARVASDKETVAALLQYRLANNLCMPRLHDPSGLEIQDFEEARV